MENKVRLIDLQMAVCLAAALGVAFTLMIGHALWMRLVRKEIRHFPALMAANEK